MLSAIKWDRQYHAMLATPLRVRDVILGHQAYFTFRLVLTATVYFVVTTAFGAVESPLGVLAIPVTVLVGLAFTAPLAAWAAHTQTKVSFIAIFRFVILPMFLFSARSSRSRVCRGTRGDRRGSHRSGTASRSAAT